MARVIDRLWLRLTLVVLVIQAALLPLLFFRLLIIVEKSHADAFIDAVRSNARVLADQLEIGDVLSTPGRTLVLLDSVILSGRGTYAEIVENGSALRSSLMAPDTRPFHGDNFYFHSDGGHIYFMSIPITKGSRDIVLRLGFDETETLEYINRARVQILLALGVFTSISVAVVIRGPGTHAAPGVDAPRARRHQRAARERDTQTRRRRSRATLLGAAVATPRADRDGGNTCGRYSPRIQQHHDPGALICAGRAR
jgi:hypothetical protein